MRTGMLIRSAREGAGLTLMALARRAGMGIRVDVICPQFAKSSVLEGALRDAIAP
jgi:hypothetical protein